MPIAASRLLGSRVLYQFDFVTRKARHPTPQEHLLQDLLP